MAIGKLTLTLSFPRAAREMMLHTGCGVSGLPQLQSQPDTGWNRRQNNCPAISVISRHLIMTALDSDTVARYLAENPDFFEEHAELFTRLKLISPVGGRTVSLQERQMEVLREKIKNLELRFATLMRVANENEEITSKFHAWSRALLAARNDVDLPHVLVDSLKSVFAVPSATLRLWGAASDYSHTWFSQPVSEDARLFANSLHTPYCGANQEFEAAAWLDDAQAPQSLAMIALRREDSGAAFGLLVIGSPDPERFTSAMATDFLGKIGETSSAALTCLLD